MSRPTSDSGVSRTLRGDAESRIKQGAAPPAKSAPSSVAALTLLYEMASAPERAEGALKLLHELQVHQVELDLQHEQIESNHREFAEELERYRGLFDFAPVGYFYVSTDGTIIESNQAGARLFGVGQEALRGARVDRFLAPESRPAFLQMLQRLVTGGANDTCEVRRDTNENVPHGLRVAASAAPGGRSFLLIFVEADQRA